MSLVVDSERSFSREEEEEEGTCRRDPHGRAEGNLPFPPDPEREEEEEEGEERHRAGEEGAAATRTPAASVPMEANDYALLQYSLHENVPNPLVGRKKHFSAFPSPTTTLPPPPPSGRSVLLTECAVAAASPSASDFEPRPLLPPNVLPRDRSAPPPCDVEEEMDATASEKVLPLSVVNTSSPRVLSPSSTDFSAGVRDARADRPTSSSAFAVAPYQSYVHVLLHREGEETAEDKAERLRPAMDRFASCARGSGASFGLPSSSSIREAMRGEVQPPQLGNGSEKTALEEEEPHRMTEEEEGPTTASSLFRERHRRVDAQHGGKTPWWRTLALHQRQAEHEWEQMAHVHCDASSSSPSSFYGEKDHGERHEKRQEEEEEERRALAPHRRLAPPFSLPDGEESDTLHLLAPSPLRRGAVATTSRELLLSSSAAPSPMTGTTADRTTRPRGGGLDCSDASDAPLTKTMPRRSGSTSRCSSTSSSRHNAMLPPSPPPPPSIPSFHTFLLDEPQRTTSAVRETVGKSGKEEEEGEEGRAKLEHLDDEEEEEDDGGSGSVLESSVNPLGSSTSVFSPAFLGSPSVFPTSARMSAPASAMATAGGSRPPKTTPREAHGEVSSPSSPLEKKDSSFTPTGEDDARSFLPLSTTTTGTAAAACLPRWDGRRAEGEEEEKNEVLPPPHPFSSSTSRSSSAAPHEGRSVAPTPPSTENEAAAKECTHRRLPQRISSSSSPAARPVPFVSLHAAPSHAPFTVPHPCEGESTEAWHLGSAVAHKTRRVPKDTPPTYRLRRIEEEGHAEEKGKEEEEEESITRAKDDDNDDGILHANSGASPNEKMGSTTAGRTGGPPCFPTQPRTLTATPHTEEEGTTTSRMVTNVDDDEGPPKRPLSTASDVLAEREDGLRVEGGVVATPLPVPHHDPTIAPLATHHTKKASSHIPLTSLFGFRSSLSSTVRRPPTQTSPAVDAMGVSVTTSPPPSSIALSFSFLGAKRNKKKPPPSPSTPAPDTAHEEEEGKGREKAEQPDSSRTEKAEEEGGGPIARGKTIIASRPPQSSVPSPRSLEAEKGMADVTLALSPTTTTAEGSPRGSAPAMVDGDGHPSAFSVTPSFSAFTISAVATSGGGGGGMFLTPSSTLTPGSPCGTGGMGTATGSVFSHSTTTPGTGGGSGRGGAPASLLSGAVASRAAKPRRIHRVARIPLPDRPPTIPLASFLQHPFAEDRYEVEKKISEGTYGEVYFAKEQFPPFETVAVKRLKRLNGLDGFPLPSLREVTALQHVQDQRLKKLKAMLDVLCSEVARRTYTEAERKMGSGSRQGDGWRRTPSSSSFSRGHPAPRNGRGASEELDEGWIMQKAEEELFTKLMEDEDEDPLPNIIHLREVLLSSSPTLTTATSSASSPSASCDICLVFDFVDHSVAGLLSGTGGRGRFGFEIEEIAYIFRRVLVALSRLHGMGIIHRDIKADNLLLSKEGRVYLADFGLCVFSARPRSGDHASHRSGEEEQEERNFTPSMINIQYRPPEMLLGKEYDEKVDVWTLGCFLAQIFLGHPPFFLPPPSAQGNVDDAAEKLPPTNSRSAKTELEQLANICHILGPLPQEEFMEDVKEEEEQGQERGKKKSHPRSNGGGSGSTPLQASSSSPLHGRSARHQLALRVLYREYLHEQKQSSHPAVATSTTVVGGKSPYKAFPSALFQPSPTFRQFHGFRRWFLHAVEERKLRFVREACVKSLSSPFPHAPPLFPSEAAIDVLCAIFTLSESRRPSAETLLEMPFFYFIDVAVTPKAPSSSVVFVPNGGGKGGGSLHSRNPAAAAEARAKIMRHSPTLQQIMKSGNSYNGVLSSALLRTGGTAFRLPRKERAAVEKAIRLSLSEKLADHQVESAHHHPRPRPMPPPTPATTTTTKMEMAPNP